MAERPTAELKTANGNVIVHRTYITGGEHRQIQDLYMREENAGNVKDGQTSTEAERLAFRLLIVSFNGETANVDDKVLDLPLSEYREVVGAIGAIANDKKKE